MKLEYFVHFDQSPKKREKSDMNLPRLVSRYEHTFPFDIQNKTMDEFLEQKV